MLKLIRLELQRVNLRPYLISSAIIGVVLLVFIYFIAFVAQKEQEIEFMSYDNIFLFTSLIGVLAFGILSATMYAKLVIEEYSGKRLALLFSYPVGRKKTFAAKVLIVFLFGALSMLVCTIFPILIFAATESSAPIVSDTLTSGILLKALGTTAMSLVAVSAIGLLAMRIGFIKKSVSGTLISAFILSAIYGNIVTGSEGNFVLSSLIVGISLLSILVVFATVSHKINHMEVA